MQFSPVYQRNAHSKKKVVVNRGGTRSSKTYSLIQLAVNWLISGYIGDEFVPRGTWSVVRKTLPSLKASALKDFEENLNQYDPRIAGAMDTLKTPIEFKFGGRTVEFFSVDDEQKIRSRKRDFLHVVEANEITFKEFTQLMIRTRVRTYLCFNPDNAQIWINTELENARARTAGDVEVLVSTYKDNPFLTPEEIFEIEYLKSIDRELWKVFGRGRYGKTEGLVFQKYEVIHKFPEGLDTVYGGLDFGFSFDPAAGVKVGRKNNNLFFHQIFYRKGLLNSDLIALMKPEKLLWVADSAEPKSIAEIRAGGVRIIPAVKGADSVRSGINRMKEFNIFVTSSSVDLLKELRAYKWDEHRPGKPIDAFNHAIDAARYPIQTKLKRSASVRATSV